MFLRNTLLAAALLVAGCAPTETELHHVVSESPRAPIFKMVVFGANLTDPARQVVEDGLVADLRKRGVDARAAYSVFPTAPADQEDARNAILDQGYEAVLRVAVDNIDTTVISTDTEDFNWTYVNIVTSLWDATEDRLVWSAESRTRNPTSDRDLAKSVSAALLPALVQAQLLLPVRPPRGP